MTSVHIGDNLYCDLLRSNGERFVRTGKDEPVSVVMIRYNRGLRVIAVKVKRANGRFLWVQPRFLHETAKGVPACTT